MAALSAKELIKVFVRGPMVGKERYLMLIDKIENASPFVMEAGEPKILRFKDTSTANAFKSGTLDKIISLMVGRNTPLVDEENNPVGVRRLTKTEEFGSSGGGSEVKDPHELMTAALILQYGQVGSQPRTVPISDYQSVSKAKNSIKLLKTYANQVDFTGTTKQKMLNGFAGDYATYARAISAANGFLTSLRNDSTVTKVWGTGAQWPTILSKYFRINNHAFFGKQDYNSSDLIVEVKRKGAKNRIYVGISLKKKGISPREADPTIINKTVVGDNGLVTFLLSENNKRLPIQGLQEEEGKLYKARAQFFYNVIAAGLNENDPKTEEFSMRRLSISDGEKEVPKVSNRVAAAMKSKQIQERNEKVKAAKQKNKAAYLSKLKTKISTNQNTSKTVLAEAFKLTQENMTKALRGAWPPDNKVFNNYFQQMDALLTNPKVMPKLCISLLNIIFKLDLIRLIKDRERHQEEFAFTLITGIGDYKEDRGLVVNAPSVIPEENSTNAITEMTSDPSANYDLRKRRGTKHAFESGATAAKLQYEIFLNNIDIAYLEIRYKGNIKNEPQFFAEITTNFKKLLKQRKDSTTTY